MQKLTILFLALSSVAFSQPQLELLCQYLNGTGETREQLNISIFKGATHLDWMGDIFWKNGSEELELKDIPVIKKELADFRLYQEEETRMETGLRMQVGYQANEKNVFPAKVWVDVGKKMYVGREMICSYWP